MNQLPVDLEDRFKNVVLKSDLAPYYSELRRLARLTFLLRVEQSKTSENLPLGCSRLGGTPDLPAGWRWATADELKEYGPTDRQFIAFVGQINFAEVPQLGQPLPSEGILYLFAGLDMSDKQLFRVRYYNGPLDNLVRHAHPEQNTLTNPDDGSYGTLRVQRFVPSVSLPDSLERRPALPDDISDFYSEFANNLYGDPEQDEPSSRLLGYPYSPYDDPLPTDDWQLLLEAQS